MALGKFIPALVLATCCTAALTAMAVRAPVSPGASVAVLFPPQTRLIQAIATIGEAGGVIERTGRWDNIVVASFPGREPPVGELRAAGAWLVFNAVVAGGCDPARVTSETRSTSSNRGTRDEGLTS